LAFLHDHGLADRLADRGYDVAVAEVDHRGLDDREIARTFEIDRRVAAAARASLEQGRVPVVLSGNCNSSLGTTAAIPANRLGVLWFDAHADFDVPDDNLSGFFDVMALSILTGSCWAALRRTIPGFREVAECDVVLVGVRDLAPYQRERLERSAVRVAYGGERETLAIEQSAVAHLDALAFAVEALYLHVDFDSLDDSYGGANQYAAPFGLTVEQLTSIAGAASARLPVAALAFTAYDPTLDEGGYFATVAIHAIEAVITATVPLPGAGPALR
jgi:arginase